jgi:hypothetical protein
MSTHVIGPHCVSAAEIEQSASMAVVAIVDVLTIRDPLQYVRRVLDYEARGWLPAAMALTMVLTACGHPLEAWPDVLDNLRECDVPLGIQSSDEPDDELLGIIELGHQEYSAVMAPNRG